MKGRFLGTFVISLAMLTSTAAMAITKDEAIDICKKNPYIDSNFLLLSCVNQEMDAASKINKLLASGGSAAQQARQTCQSNPYIDTNFLMLSCMQQEINAGALLQQ